jgi:peptidyl-prolyl cis-trans isomerase C
MSWAAREPTMWPYLAEASATGIGIEHEANQNEVYDHLASTLAAVWMEAAHCRALEDASSIENGGWREADEKALILIRVLIGAVRVPAPDEESCRRFYEQNRRRFRGSAICDAAYILIAADAGNVEARRTAEAKANALLAKLRLDPLRFNELGRLYSDCPSGADGGHLGRITYGQTTPEFERALVAVAPGTLCPALVATRQGFHIIRLDRRIDGSDLPYEVVAGRVAELLADRAKGRAVAQYFAHLVSLAQIQGVEFTDVLGLH